MMGQRSEGAAVMVFWIWAQGLVSGSWLIVARVTLVGFSVDSYSMRYYVLEPFLPITLVSSSNLEQIPPVNDRYDGELLGRPTVHPFLFWRRPAGPSWAGIPNLGPPARCAGGTARLPPRRSQARRISRTVQGPLIRLAPGPNHASFSLRLQKAKRVSSSPCPSPSWSTPPSSTSAAQTTKSGYRSTKFASIRMATPRREAK